MRKVFIIIAVVIQILILAYMAGKREYITHQGDIIYLRTAPIDPRDIFRGDYVRLDYLISTVPLSKLKGSLLESVQRDQVVYAAGQRDSNGVFLLDYISDTKPVDTLFIKGRIKQRYWQKSKKPTRPVNVKYGIEKYFVEQGKGIDIENLRGRRGEFQTPMIMEVALGGDGTAVIKGFHWNKLASKIEITRRPATQRQSRNNQNTEPDNPFLSPALKFSIKNVSEQPLAILDSSEHCYIKLKQVASWTNKTYTMPQNTCSEPIDTSHLIVLQPNQIHEMEFDLSDKKWHITDDNIKTDEIGVVAINERFRFIYTTPSQDQLRGLLNENLIWQDKLESQAFNSSGRID